MKSIKLEYSENNYFSSYTYKILTKIYFYVKKENLEKLHFHSKFSIIIFISLGSGANTSIFSLVIGCTNFRL